MGFPQLLNPTAALIAAAIAVPLLLLLYFLKLRRSPAPVSSTLLWKRSVEDLQVNAPFQWIRRNLLLLLQLLVLLALLLALARPVGDAAQQAGERSILLIDRSASMNADDGNGGTRLDEAKERAKGVVDTMRRGDQAMVIAFSDDTGTSPVQKFTESAGQIKDAIDGIEPSDRLTKPAAAYKQANASSSFMDVRLRPDELQAATVFLFSDGRVSEADIGELSIRGELRYERLGTPTAKNLAVVAASVKRNYERPDEAQVFARVANFGDTYEKANLRVSVAAINEDGTLGDFEPTASGPVRVSLPPKRWTDAAWREAAEETNAEALAAADRQLAEDPPREGVDVRLSLPVASVVRVEIVDDQGRPVEDALKADDEAYVVVPPPEPLRVLLVTRGTYWLRLLVETQRLDDPKIVSPAEYEALLADGGDDGAATYDVTIFDNYQPTALPEAGTFVFSGQLPPEGATEIEAITGDDGVALFYEGSGVLDWDRDHPMLAGLNLNRLWAAEGRRVPVPTAAEMLIEGVDGPMAILERLGRRTNLVFTFDLAQSNWPRHRTFPIFFYLAFEYFTQSGDVGTRESFRPGEVVAVPPVALERADVEDGVALLGPNGSRLTARVDSTGGLTLGPLPTVGLYRTQPPVPGFEQIAVSLLDANESNLLPGATDPGNLSASDETTGAAAYASAAGLAEDASPDDSAVGYAEWWWWLVAAGVGMLMIEWFVYTRRVGG